MDKPKRIIHIARKTESLWQKNDALCLVGWVQWGVICYELLKPGETINTKHYQQQLTDLNRSLLEKRSEPRKRQHKVISLHDNAPSHTIKLVRDTLQTLNWEVLLHAAYFLDLAPSDYHLFASMTSRTC